MNTPASENKHLHCHDHEHEDCCCGHDHHEHHHHEHEDCCCGHDHHEHHHEHHHHEHEDCCCGHDHHEHHHHEHHAQHDDGSEKRVYILENLGCAHCAARMEERIQALPGVKYASITFATRQLRVSADHYKDLLPKLQEVCAGVESQVKVCEMPDPSGKAAVHHHPDEEKADLAQIIAGAALFALGLICRQTGLAWYPAVFVLGYLILGGKILLEAGRNILHGQIFDENFLMSIATIGAFAIRKYPEAMGVMLFYRIGEYFEHRAVHKSRSQIMDAVDLRPEVVNLLSGADVRAIPAADAQVGDVLLIRPGDRIPLDGVIVEGSSRLDTSPITGEPVPISVHCGDSILSGCVNTSGQLKLRVEKPLSESMVSRILNSVENAAASKPKIDRFITRFSRVYTPCVVLIALATAIIPSLVSGKWNYWVYTALTFLVMSCPCALVLSVPLAFFSGIGAGSRKGILFKGGASIEAMARLKAVAMDKTGTITQGNFRLQSIVALGKYNENDLLHLCASCEQFSTHPIAHSIIAAAKERGIAAKQPLSMKEIAGHGVEAVLEEGEVLCGNRKLMEAHGVELSAAETAAYGAEIFVAVEGKLVGMLRISDTIKPDAAQAIHCLKALGLHTAMLTGDSEAGAKAVAAETGVDQVHARLLPQDKLKALQAIRSEQGSVMFVGDGINDAPVLAGADVGAAMGSGADAAIEAADAVFMSGSMESIPDSIAIARRTNRIAMQNVVFALAVKLAAMLLGLLGFANMWMAVFADTGVAMICVMNSIRILYQKDKKK